MVDVAPVIARAPLVPESRNEVFNIGADRPYSILELAQEIADAFGVEVEVEHLPPRNEVVHAFSDHSKLAKVFDRPEPLDLRTGISRTAEWVKAHGPRDPVNFSGEIEVARNLPPSWRAPDQAG